MKKILITGGAGFVGANFDLKDCKKLERFILKLKPVFPPLSSLPMFRKANNPVAEFVGQRGVCLPAPLNLTKEQADYISDNILELTAV